MVGVVVAGYTDIIERGIEQQRGAKPMTTKQNDTNLMSDEQLDLLSGGPHYTDFSRAGYNFDSTISRFRFRARGRADMYAGMTYTDRGTQPYIKRRLGSDDELW